MATILINRMLVKSLHWITPFETLHHKPPSYVDFKTFSYLCYAATTPLHRDKFDPKGRQCVFIGYPLGQKEYKLYDLDNKHVFVSRDVILYETIFPFKFAGSGMSCQSQAHLFPDGTLHQSDGPSDLVISSITHIDVVVPSTDSLPFASGHTGSFPSYGHTPTAI